MRVDLGEWRPDLPDTDLGASQVAKNVVPALGQYNPFKELATYTDALAARCRGAFSAKDSSNTVHLFAGEANALKELENDGSWTDVSRSAGYTAIETTVWTFTQFGQQIVATNYRDAPQVFTMGTATAFSDLPGSPPKARYVKTLRDFVVLSHTEDNPTEVRWSAINDAASWTIGTNQADRQTFPDHGHCQGVFGSEVGYVFFDYAIYRMTYVGSPIVWRFDEISHGRGTLHYQTVVQVGSIIFFISDDGFYMLSGDQVQPIGHEKVDEFFLGDFNKVYAYRVSAAADPVNKLILWSYPSRQSVSGEPDKIIAYNWVTQRWSLIEYGVERIFTTIGKGYTLDNLDTLSGSLDALTIPLDSPLLSGGSLTFGAFGTDFKLGILEGDNLEATMETKEWTLDPTSRTFVTGMRALCDASNLTMSLGSRDRIADDVTYSDATAQETHGFVPVRQTGRYHRAKLVVPAAADWSTAQAVEFEFTSVGRR